MAAPEAYDVGFVLDQLDRPSCVSGVTAPSALSHSLLILIGDEILVQVASELH